MEKKNKAAIRVKFLPDEIEENILSRIPVKTILRFISVCKSWYSLFLDHRFNTIFKRKNNNPLLLARLYKEKQLIVTDNSSVIHSRHVVNPRPDPSIRHPRFIFDPHLDIHRSLVVYCNGIACIHDIYPVYIDGKFIEYICLWNPALRVVKYIQTSGGGLRRSTNSVRVLVGFGFDIRSKDYKVVRYQESVLNKEFKKIEIYSLSSDSWRTVKGATRNVKGFFTSSICHARVSGVYVNETHHWAIISTNNELERPYSYSAVIISFDMRDEVFKKITIPNEICKKRELKMILFKYKETLATVTYSASYRGNNDHEIWVMNDYGMSESWTKVRKIDLPSMTYFRGFLEDKNELIFSTVDVIPDNAGKCGKCSIVIDAEKLEMKDDSPTATIEILKDAVEVTTFRESLTLLGSNNLVHY